MFITVEPKLLWLLVVDCVCLAAMYRFREAIHARQAYRNDSEEGWSQCAAHCSVSRAVQETIHGSHGQILQSHT